MKAIYFLWLVYSLTSPYGHLSITDSSFGPRNAKNHTFHTSILGLDVTSETIPYLGIRHVGVPSRDAWTRILGKLSCTQVKCTWLLPSYVKEVPYARVRDIHVSSERKLKADLDAKIDSIGERREVCVASHGSNLRTIKVPTLSEMNNLCRQLNKGKVKPVALSLKEPYSDQFFYINNLRPFWPWEHEFVISRLKACLHGVGDPGLVGLVSFVFTLWGTQNKRNLPHQTGVPHSM